MKKLLNRLAYIQLAPEHRETRLLMNLAALVFGWCVAGVMHSLGAAGF